MRDYDLVIWQVTTFDGESYEGGEALEHLEDADQVFYSVSYGAGEEFYRWVAGPFEDLDGLEAAIGDEVEHYEDVAV
jgi:hypothetical protein